MRNPKITRIVTCLGSDDIDFEPFVDVWATHRWADIRPRDRHPKKLVWVPFRKHNLLKHCRKCGAIHNVIMPSRPGGSVIAAFYLPGTDTPSEPVNCVDSIIHGVIV